MSRNLSLDLLRIIAMILIVSGHIAGGLIPKLDYISSISRSFWSSIPFFIAFHINIFILITGYFGIKSVRHSVTKNLFLILSGLLIIFIFSLFDSSYNFDIKSLAFPLSNNPWWFMRIYIMLCLISPILNTVINSVNGREYLKIMILTMLIDVYFGYYQRMESVHWGGYNLIHFVNLYLLGAWLRKTNMLESRRISKYSKTRLLLIISGLFTFKLLVYTSLHFFGIKDYFMDYNNPFNIALAVMIVIFFHKIKIHNSSWIIAIAPAMLSVYMLHTHPMIWHHIESIFSIAINDCNSNELLESLSIAIAILLIFISGIIFYQIQRFLIEKSNNLFSIFNFKTYQNGLDYKNIFHRFLGKL